ncbi:tapasin-related protein-like [Pseudophryne corroboree]|uniref:tapasin-related protein-like n=1 Tax=Pseudophryne corroboree TaxID=495146 RepID=UPI003081AF0A
MDSSSRTVSIILCALLISGNWSTEEGAFLKLPCLYEKFTGDQWLADPTLPPNKALLVLRSNQELDVEHLDFEGVKFIFKDSPVNLMPFLKEDSEDLHCEIKSYFTDNTQILWPGVPTRGNTLDSWYIGRVQHRGDKFHITAFFTRLSETPSVEEKEDDTRPVLATFMVRTQTPKVYGRLKQNVLLDCVFTVDHRTDVSVTWSYQGKGRRDVKLLSYNASTKKLQYNSKEVLMQMAGLQNGNASLLVSNLTMENEGLFTCTISVASLFADQQIRLKIRESPRVTTNVDSVSLKEGQEQKFVCDASNYYPLDVNIEWLREDKYSRLLPTLVSHVIYSTHKNYRDGTYSLSGFFLYRASLRDNGVTYTCRVEHESLKQPLKKSVRVTVLESTEWNLDETDCLTNTLILIIVIILVGILLFLVKIYCTGGSDSKSKLY